MENTTGPLGVRGVGSSNLPVPTNENLFPPRIRPLRSGQHLLISDPLNFMDFSSLLA